MKEWLKKHWLVTCIALLVIGVIMFRRDTLDRRPPNTFNVAGQKLPELDRTSFAQLPDNFPAWLILGHEAQVTVARKLATDPKFSARYQVQFESTDTFSFLRDQYLLYFKKSGWVVASQTTPSILEATRDRESVRIDFAPRTTSGLLVTVSYQLGSALTPLKQ